MTGRSWRAATGYQPAQLAPAGRTFKVLTNRDIVAVGELQPADRMLLSAYAEQTAGHVWTLSTASLLAAVDDGRPLDHLQRFLRDRAQPTHHQVPSVEFLRAQVVCI